MKLRLAKPEARTRTMLKARLLAAAAALSSAFGEQRARRRLPRLFLLSGAVVLILSGTGCERTQSFPLVVDAPPQEALKALKGQWMALNYWALWCAPCREEAPELNALQAQNPSVAVRGFNFDAPPGPELYRQMRELEIAYPVFLRDPGPALKLPRVDALPVTFIFDPDGNLKAALKGPQTRERLEKEMELL